MSTTPTRHTKKPVTIEAVQFETDNDDGSCLDDLVDWITSNGGDAHHDGTSLFIETLEGTHRADCGDWIIRGVKGEFYPCKPEIFAMTYDAEGEPSAEKTLHNSDVSGARQNVTDIKVVGDGDLWRLLCKASSQAEGWMKSTKAMEVPGGCLVQVTTQQRNPDGSHAVAEALAFVPDVCAVYDTNGGRRLAPDTL